MSPAPATIHGERVLVARHSDFQEILLTEDATGLRSLRFGEGEGRQSVVKPGDPGHLELPYTRVLPAALAFMPDPARMLIIGLGGGTLPMFFHRYFPRLTIDVVELDPAVVEVAREYCGLAEDARLRAHVADGRDFVEASPGGYDVIILDCFDVDSIPRHLATLEFLRSVRRALTPAGIAVANVWGRAINPRYAHMLVTYRAAFEDVWILDVPGPGTKIFVALTRAQEMTRPELLRRVGGLTEQADLPFALSEAIAGFRQASAERVESSAVLND